MSLASFAVRQCTVQAIRAAIWSGMIVADSPANALDLLDKAVPVVAVYTVANNDGFEGNELLSGDPRVSLYVQIYLPTTFTVTFGGAPLTLDTREEGADTLLDVVGRRILSALVGQAEPWSALWGELVTRTRTLADGSYLLESDEVRVTARQITLECETLYDPIPGAPPAGPWARLIALMRTDTSPRSVAPLADWLASEIAGPTALTQDERDRIDLGLSAYAAQAVDILPIVRGSEIGEVAVTVNGPDGDEVVIPGPAGAAA